MQTRFVPSLVVICLLLAIGLVVGLVLWATIRPDSPDGSSGGTTVIPTTTPATVPAPVAAGAIASLSAYDPAGDGHENDEMAGAALADGIAATNWQTECYGDRYLGKEGVGLVVNLAPAAAGTLTFDVTTAPFQLFVYATGDATVPDSLTGWGEPVASKFVGQQPSSVEVTIGTPAQHVLVWFVEVGNAPSCSAEHPHRAVVGEVTFAESG